MKKITALVLALIMVCAIALTGCGKTEPAENITEPVAPAETPTTANEPEGPIPMVDPPVELQGPDWNDLVGEWYLQTMYYDEDGTEDGPGFWNAAEQNVDARITIYASEGIDYFWSTKYSVDDDFEDLPFNILTEPAAEGETYMDWCIEAQPYDYETLRIALADENTLVCYEHYLDESIDLDSTHKCIYTKDGPIEFHKSMLSYSDILGTWYQYDYEVDGDSGLCFDVGMHTSITFYDDMTADYYSGNIEYPEEAVKYEGCAVTIVEEPILSWLPDDDYPERQDWSVIVDIPKDEFSEEEHYQFGFTDDYTVTMYLEIIADGGSYHVGSVGNFGYFSPYDGQGMHIPQMPAIIQGYIDEAAENQWVVAITNPDEELVTALDYEEWPLNDCSGYYEWDNMGELVLAPVHTSMQINIYTGSIMYDSDGNYIGWDKGDLMYDAFLEPGDLWRGMVDLPDAPADASLCLFIGFGEMGLDGGEEYFTPLCKMSEGKVHLSF